MNSQPPSLSQIVEALIFASPEPLTTAALVRTIRASAASIEAEKKAAAEEAANEAAEAETVEVPTDPLLDEPDTSESPVLDAPADPPPYEVPSEVTEAASEGAEAAGEDVQAGREESAAEAQAAGELVVNDAEAADAAPVEETTTPWLKVTEEEVLAALAELVRSYEAEGRAYTLQERASGWRVFTRPEYTAWVRGLFPERKAQRLSQPALETLAIIAYRQPITKAAIEAVRGVSVDGPLQKLMDQNLVRIAGRADLPGRPLLYETTGLFFEHFGIRSVDDLPNASELRRVELPKPENEKAEPATPEAVQPELPAAEAGGEAPTTGETPAS